MSSALKRIQVSPIPVGPADSALGAVGEDALRSLLGTEADQIQASAAANDNPGQPPVVTMQPIPNPGEQPKKEDPKTLDDLFSQAQKSNQK
jgi:penicillin-binding protein 1A